MQRLILCLMCIFLIPSGLQATNKRTIECQDDHGDKKRIRTDKQTLQFLQDSLESENEHSVTNSYYSESEEDECYTTVSYSDSETEQSTSHVTRSSDTEDCIQLMELPPELLQFIFSGPDTILAFRNTNAQASEVMSNHQCWMTKKYSFSHNSLPPEDTPIALGSLGNLLSEEELAASPIQHMRKLPNLSGLRVTMLPHPKAILEIGALQQLQFLSIQFLYQDGCTLEHYRIALEALSIAISSLPNLSCLTVSVPHAAACFITIPLMENLKYLYLRRSTYLGAEPASKLPLGELLKNTPKLESLGIQEWKLDEETAKAIAECTHLKNLGISGIHNLQIALKLISEKCPLES